MLELSSLTHLLIEIGMCLRFETREKEGGGNRLDEDDAVQLWRNARDDLAVALRRLLSELVAQSLGVYHDLYSTFSTFPVEAADSVDRRNKKFR